MFFSYFVVNRIATSIHIFEDCFLLKTKNTRNLIIFFNGPVLKKIFKNLMLVFIKIFLLFPIWNLKAILTKHNFQFLDE